jgi:hypothetical protein
MPRNWLYQQLDSSLNIPIPDSQLGKAMDEAISKSNKREQSERQLDAQAKELEKARRRDDKSEKSDHCGDSSAVVTI